MTPLEIQELKDGEGMIGHKFGKLTVLSRQFKNKRGQAHWLCKCKCGNEKIIAGHHLRSGHTKSCGCLNKPHGMCGSPVYRIWQNMIKRCEKEKNPAYKDYGNRGITVCERWHDFINFYADMGDRPKGLTLERIDNNKGYSPNNCKWATMKEQSNNRRDNIIIKHKGQEFSLIKWAKLLNVKYGTLYWRLKIANWPKERVLIS